MNLFLLLGLMWWPSQKPEPITGTASFYADRYRGARMANGRPYDPEAMTAASWDFPLGTQVTVRHADRKVVVTITDRGPTRVLRARGRVIDLSKAAFSQLASPTRGLIEVTVEVRKGGRP